jgi:hypothetical protein
MKKIQLSIPEPCQQNWHNMTPTQQGRFCNACAKEVIDFSEMSDSEVLNYFSKVKNEKVCGQAWPDQLERSISALPRKKIYWYFNCLIAFILFFGKAGSSKAQTKRGIILPKPAGNSTLLPSKNIAATKFFINDVIADEHGQPIPFASIRLLNSTVGVVADEFGKFKLEIEKFNSTIEVSALNYETKQVVIYDVSEREIVLTKSSQLMKEVVLQTNIEYNRCRRMAGGISVTRIEKRNIIKDTISNWITAFKPAVKIYPSPVARGNTFTVALTLKQTGRLTMQLNDAKGRMLLQKQFNAITKEHKEQLQTASTWSAGIYYLRVLDEKGKLISVANLMIQ